jgi:hypothetical protein
MSLMVQVRADNYVNLEGCREEGKKDKKETRHARNLAGGNIGSHDSISPLTAT